MVGIVVVSHSARVAEGVVELAREMGGEDVRIEPAGGMAEPAGAIGTDAELVKGAIERASGDDGVLVLMDLGSALMTAEMAVEMADDATRVVLSEAPLVEGAIAAAATARGGATLDEVAAEARGALGPKAAQLGVEPAGGQATEEAAGLEDDDEGETLRLRVENRLGLHARPAARLVTTARRFDAELSLVNETTGAGHYWDFDSAGVGWHTGSGGSAAFDVSDPLAPKALNATNAQGTATPPSSGRRR